MLKLDANENCYGCSPLVPKILQTTFSASHLYPPRTHEKLIQKLGEVNQIDPQFIKITSGSSSALDLIIQTYSKVSDKILFLEKSFIAYRELTRVYERKMTIVPMSNHQINLDEIKKKLTKKIKIFFLDNPNNPTGFILNHFEILELLNSCNKETYIVIDEAYIEYVNTDLRPKITDLLKKFSNLIVVRTFSKIYGLAAFRIGYIIAVPEVIKNLNHFEPPFAVNSFALKAAEASLSDSLFINQCYLNNKKQRAYLAKQLNLLHLNFIPSQTNFVFVYFDKEKRHLSQNLIENEKWKVLKRLNDMQIKVCDLQMFGIANAIRITIGTAAQNKKLIKALAIPSQV